MRVMKAIERNRAIGAKRIFVKTLLMDLSRVSFLMQQKRGTMRTESELNGIVPTIKLPNRLSSS